jgi:hypothetical protein
MLVACGAGVARAAVVEWSSKALGRKGGEVFRSFR